MNSLISRRRFLKILGAAGTGIAASGYLFKLFRGEASFASPSIADIGYSHEAMFYERLDAETVKCVLCPHECVLKDGQRSFCRAREPKNGKLYALTYELASAVHVDPIEKKPLYHMMPGSASFSIAAAGCNLRCKFCQNWQISQNPPENTTNQALSCQSVVDLAKKNGCRSIAYTYTEPMAFYEYAYDTAQIAKRNKIKNICVTAGWVNPEPLIKLAGYMDGANIDLKGFSDDYLKNVCSQRLKPLLEAIKIWKREGVWVELTNLIVPSLNDDMTMIRDMCAWIRAELGPDTPLHFSRFWPMYKLKDLPPTPVDTLQKARETAIREGLNYVYIGNINDASSSSTYCPKCKKTIVKRMGYYVAENNISASSCRFCGHRIAGVWE